MQILIMFVLLVISYLLQSLLTKKPEQPKAASFGDFDFPQASEGTPQIIVFGDVWTPDWTVLWYGNYKNIPIKKEGKK